MFDEMNHEAILCILEAVGWALNNVSSWSSNRMRRVDRFSVARYGKGVQLGCNYTLGDVEMPLVMITATQVMEVFSYDLAHSYVNVRHTLYKQGLGAPMGGLHVLSAAYAIPSGWYSRRVQELALPCAVCRYNMGNVYQGSGLRRGVGNAGKVCVFFS